MKENKYSQILEDSVLLDGVPEAINDFIRLITVIRNGLLDGGLPNGFLDDNGSYVLLVRNQDYGQSFCFQGNPSGKIAQIFLSICNSFGINVSQQFNIDRLPSKETYSSNVSVFTIPVSLVLNNENLVHQTVINTLTDVLSYKH